MPSSRARKTASPTLSPASVAVLPDAPAAEAVNDPDGATPGGKAPRKAAAKKAAVKTTAIKKAAAKKAAAKKTARKTASKTARKTARKTAVKTAAVLEAPPPVLAAVAVAAKRAAPRKRARTAPVVVEEAVEVQAAPAPVVEPEAPPPRTWSELRLEPDACGRRLVWQAAEACPEPLLRQVASWLRDDGDVGPQHDEALLALQALADEHGHDLRVDPALWHALAAARDVRWRVHLLEQAYPEGPASTALQALWPAAAGPLAPFHAEGALFAACAGRCVLADEAALEPMSQALLAVTLFARHFGVERVLVVCADEAVPRWQRGRLRAGFDDSVQWRLGSNVPADGWVPELLIVDDSAAPLDDATAAAVRRLACDHALVLMHEPAERPQALADWLAWLDGTGVGALRQFLRRHRSEDGWSDLDRLRDSLGTVMLCRTRARWLQPVPGRRDRLVWLPLGAAERAAQAEAVRRLQPVVERWRRVQYVSDVDQVGVQAALADLRAACAPDTPERLQALQALWTETARPGITMRVVLGEGPGEGVHARDRAQRMAAALQNAGLPARSEAAVVLIGEPQADAAPREVQVCAALPWPAAAAPVRAGGPVTYLLTQGGLDEHRLLLRCCDPASDAALADPARFRQGPRLAQRMAALAGLVDRLQPRALRDTR